MNDRELLERGDDRLPAVWSVGGGDPVPGGDDEPDPPNPGGSPPGD